MLATGVAELTIGLILVSGIATRYVTAVLSIFFLATWVIVGQADLVGHLAPFGLALLLILHGSGSYSPASLMRKSIVRVSTAPVRLPNLG